MDNSVIDKNSADTALSETIVAAFEAEFAKSYRTRLLSGVDEPIYLPAIDGWNLIYFARGHWASALHEISHWFIAGPYRRTQTDYGYWYEPDGRSVDQQRLFERVEVKPQAIEWLLSSALGRDFVASFDNIQGHGANPLAFRQAVRIQALNYLEAGLPSRAQNFLNRLLDLTRNHRHFVAYWDRVSRDRLLPG